MGHYFGQCAFIWLFAFLWEIKPSIKRASQRGTLKPCLLDMIVLRTLICPKQFDLLSSVRPFCCAGTALPCCCGRTGNVGYFSPNTYCSAATVPSAVQPNLDCWWQCVWCQNFKLSICASKILVGSVCLCCWPNDRVETCYILGPFQPQMTLNRRCYYRTRRMVIFVQNFVRKDTVILTPNKDWICRLSRAQQ